MKDSLLIIIVCVLPFCSMVISCLRMTATTYSNQSSQSSNESVPSNFLALNSLILSEKLGNGRDINILLKSKESCCISPDSLDQFGIGLS